MAKRLILGVTVGGSSRLLDNQAKYFKGLGYDVYLISQNHYKEKVFCEREGITHLPVDIIANISPLRDLKALLQIISAFRRVKPDIVNVGTPKMALLGLTAAWLLRVKMRVYTCRGFRFETEKGLVRYILLAMERVSVALANKIVYVSPSLMAAAENSKVLDKDRSVVIGRGSSNGVNIEVFDRKRVDIEMRATLINKYQLQNTLVIGFVGRVCLHKGAYELVNTFQRIFEEYPHLRLIMMGHIKCDLKFEEQFRSHKGIIHIPFQDDVPLYMSLFDIFVLPSWREGFPNVPIQAAAMGIPILVSDATGCVDSVNEGVNGLVFKKCDSEDLYRKLKLYVRDPILREKHSKNGPEWAVNFRSDMIWNEIDKIYKGES